jgi:hypothetical protein
MKALLAGTAILLTTVSANAADISLPKEYWGKWCVVGSTTGGGSPRFWEYSRSRAECDAADIPKDWRSQDMTIGPYSMDNCKAIRRMDWKQDNAPVYFVIYRCKGKEVTAKFFSLDRKDGSLTAQYLLK